MIAMKVCLSMIGVAIGGVLCMFAGAKLGSVGPLIGGLIGFGMGIVLLVVWR